VEWIKDKGHYDEYLKDWGSEHGGKYPTADLATRISALPEDETFEAFTANETIKLIKEQKNRDKPFYCWSTFYRPHQPYNAQKRFLDLYKYDKWGEGTLKGDSIKKPSTLNQPAESLPPALKNWREGANKVWCLDKAAKDEQLYRFYIASYYALVSEIDHHIGRIIQALEEEGLLENTIIVYASDHGDFVGGHGMVEKCAIGHNVYEETLRVPYIVSYPGVVKKQTCNDLVELFSIYPTLCDLAKIDLPKSKHPTAAVSVVDTLTEEKPVGEKFVVSENWSQATVITDRYKLGIWLDPKKIPGYDRSPLRQHYGDIRDFGDMLFDRKKDPHEVNNLIDDPDYKEIAKHLYACYEKFDSNVPRIEFK
jgi:arylsulfatase A-like enzyme